MTTLRSFQEEIQDIRNRQVAKQRQHLATNGDTPSDVPAKETVRRAPPSDEAIKEIERDLVTSLLEAKHDTARNLLATLLTRGGEHILRAGEHPTQANILSGAEFKQDANSWTGTPRSEEVIETLRQGIIDNVKEIGGKASVLFHAKGDRPRIALLLRLPPTSVETTPEVRCAVVGNVDSGKSTTLGVLTRGALDDGRGRARVALFRHKHEIETGRTSSVGMEILGFDTSGLPILPDIPQDADIEVIKREKLGWEQISVQAAKIVSFIDLAGHERYLKTTLYGMTSGAPSCVVLTVGANAGLIGMSKEHLAIALALSVPVVVIITKVDMTPANKLQETINQVIRILKSPGCRKTPVFVKSMEAAVEIAVSFGLEKLCPIFQVSNVTGQGLDFLRTFLNLLPPSDGDVEKFPLDQPFEYSVTEIWSVPYVGTVVNGIINSGTIKTGDLVLVGPDANGKFQQTVVRSMQRKRADVNTAEAGQCVSLALKRIRRSAIRKGMVLVHKTEQPPPAIHRFEGQVLILYHNTTMQQNYQAMLHCGAVRQTVRIVSMDHPLGILRTGDRATVTFEFISHPEFVKVGMKLLFREGKTKGLGVITKLL